MSWIKRRLVKAAPTTTSNETTKREPFSMLFSAMSPMSNDGLPAALKEEVDLENRLHPDETFGDRL